MNDEEKKAVLNCVTSALVIMQNLRPGLVDERRDLEETLVELGRAVHAIKERCRKIDKFI